MTKVPHCLVTLLVSFVSIGYGQDAIPLSEDGDHVCTETRSFQASRSVSTTEEYEMRYYTRCGLFGTCSRLRLAYRVVYSQQFYTNYREVSVCCDGYTQSDDSCTPCSSDTWGPDCANDCLCQNNGICDPTDGRCVCSPGYMGDNCQTPCSTGQYGPDCSLSCDCPESCDPVNGTCTCDPGFTGPSCADLCPSGTYGQDCSQLCDECLNEGVCDPVTGLCICQGGYQGAVCNSLALGICGCTNGGQCGEGGACICPNDFEGRLCEIKAFGGFLGHGRSLVTASLAHLTHQFSRLRDILSQPLRSHHVEKRQTNNATNVNETMLVIHDCPEHLIIMADDNVTEVTWEEPTAFSSNGPVTLIERTHVPGSDFMMDSVTTVTYIFRDPTGVVDKCEFVVQVTGDTMGPLVTGCPEDVTVVRELGSGNTNVTWSEPVTTEDDPSITLYQSHSPGSTFPLGVTLVNYTFTDASANSAYCTFNVSVSEVDTVPPTVIGCPDNITREVEIGSDPPRVLWSPPTAEDASGQVILFPSHTPNGTFPIGNTHVEYVFMDSALNRVVCSFTISVVEVDTTPPKIISCPGNIQKDLEVGTNEGATAEWTEPVVTDNSGNKVLMTPLVHHSGDTFPPGNTSVMYLFFDNNGNAAVCSFVVTVTLVDNTPPIILNCPSNQIRSIELGLNQTEVEWPEVAAHDASGVVMLMSQTFFPGDTFPIGNTAVEYVFNDASGNRATCRFFVIVMSVDTTKPAVTNCPAGIVEWVELGTQLVVISWTAPSATDLSGSRLTVSATHTPPANFTIGDHTVTYQFVDPAGNTAECSFNVTVRIVDTTVPMIMDCPSNIFRVIELGTPSIEVDWRPPNATDLSGATLTVNSSHTPPASLTVGVHTVSYQFTDPSGNKAVCSFDVIITTEDTTVPVILSCPGNLSVTTELGMLSKAVTWDQPLAVDSSNILVEEHSHNSGEVFPLGITSVNVTFTDGAGNMAVCSFYVNLTTVDTTPPTVENCPGMITKQVELGTEDVAVFWENITAVDLSPTERLFETHSSGSVFTPGMTFVLVVFTDAARNQANCNFQVHVIEVDTTPPVISDCPPPVVNRTIELNETSAVVFWTEPTATDLSGVAERVFRTFPPGSEFSVGVTNVAYTFMDDAQNTLGCSFDIHVIQRDTQPPRIIGCPDDVTRMLEVGEVESVEISWEEPTAMDQSGAALAHQTHFSGDDFKVGETVVTYTFIDTAGISNQCAFAVTIVQVDTTSPVISGCPGDIDRDLEVGMGLSLTVSWVEPTATDNSGMAPILSHHNFAPGDMFSPGRKSVIYVFEDMAGNRAECQFDVVVTSVDTEPPHVIFCPDDIEAPPIELGTSVAMVSWVREPFAVDFSQDEVTLINNTHTPGDAFYPGVTLVEYRYRDSSFNEATCSFTVTVREVDTTPPTIHDCPEVVTSTVELGTAEVAVSWSEPTAWDVSGNVTLISQSHTPGSLFYVGQTAVTYLYRDGSDNEAECSFSVIISTVDTTPPVVISCPSDILVTIGRTETESPVSWATPQALDLSGTARLEGASASSGNTFPVGTTMVTYFFSDQSMNTAICRFMVTVQTEAPDQIVIVGCPVDFEVKTGPEEDITVVWGEPTAMNHAGTTFLQSQSHTPPVSLTAGSTEVVYTFADGVNNQASCRFIITVVEVHDLVCPGINITAFVLPTDSEVAVNLSQSLLSRDQGSVNITSSHTPGGQFPIGTSDVTYTITADDGRMVECVLTVTVYDEIPPEVLDCPTDISIGQSSSSQGLAVTWSEPSATDNSGNVTLIRNFQPGDTFQSGTHTVLYQFVDSSGNVASCSFRIILTRTNPNGIDSAENQSLSSDVLVTIIASSTLILSAILIIAICLLSICCSRTRKKRRRRELSDYDDGAYFEDDYFQGKFEDRPEVYVNRGYSPPGGSKSEYDEPPSANNSIKKKRPSVDSRRSSHYSQTLPLRPIQDPMDEGTRTIKRAYNGPVPGMTNSLPRQKSNHPQLEVELHEDLTPCPGFEPIPEELDSGDYFEIGAPRERRVGFQDIN